MGASFCFLILSIGSSESLASRMLREGDPVNGQVRNHTQLCASQNAKTANPFQSTIPPLGVDSLREPAVGSFALV
jgi:hypothetical protein